MKEAILIGVGGALGALSRYGISAVAKHVSPSPLPFGTFVANMLGCFAIGLVAALATESSYISKELQAALTVGFLGGLTTFSSFSYETIRLADTQDWRYSVANVLANVLVGVSMTIAGMLVARRWIAI